MPLLIERHFGGTRPVMKQPDGVLLLKYRLISLLRCTSSSALVSCCMVGFTVVTIGLMQQREN